MNDKHAIHTTISTDALRILERYEKELGAKNIVLERALRGMDKLRFKERTDPDNISRIIKRVKVGIPGVDETIQGGIPEGFIVAVAGPPGTGKTTFSMQFLVEGLKNNEKCVYFSFEEKVENLVKQSIRFGWDIGKYLSDGYLEIFGLTMLSNEEILEIFDAFKPKRIVFDPFSMFFDTIDFRKSSEWRSVLREIKKQKITSIAITEKMHGLEVKKYDEADFLCDGVIFLDKDYEHAVESREKYTFCMQKMRATEIKSPLHNIILGANGLFLNGNANIKKALLKKVGSDNRKESKREESGKMAQSLRELKEDGITLPDEVANAIFSE